MRSIYDLTKSGVVAVLSILFVSVAAFAMAPSWISYQGYLTNPDGTPMDTTLDITYRIYHDEWGGTPAFDWIVTTTVTNGYFEALLGAPIDPLSPDIFDDGTMFLGIQVGTDTEMTPLMPFAAVPYSYRVATVDGATGGAITSSLIVNTKVNAGSGNENTGAYSSVFGLNNFANEDFTFVGGGSGNSNGGSWGVIGGGENNHVNVEHGFIGAGRGNETNGDAACVLGGQDNIASGQRSIVGGGSENTAWGAYSFIGGGQMNVDSGANHGTIAGGQFNTVINNGASVGGGASNKARGMYSVVPGGNNNLASGNYAFAAGRRAKANHSGSWVWADGVGTDFVSTTYDQFNIRASGGVRIYTDSLATIGVTLNHNDATWNSVSDRNRKTDFRDVNTAEILDKVARLPIQRWRYKGTDTGIDHIGPMAQDFYAAFALGASDTTISSIDPDGVALAAIQELYKQNQELKAELSELRAQMQTLAAGEKKTYAGEK